MADAGIALSAENKSKKGNFRGPKNEKKQPEAANRIVFGAENQFSTGCGGRI